MKKYCGVCGSKVKPAFIKSASYQKRKIARTIALRKIAMTFQIDAKGYPHVSDTLRHDGAVSLAFGNLSKLGLGVAKFIDTRIGDSIDSLMKKFFRKDPMLNTPDITSDFVIAKNIQDVNRLLQKKRHELADEPEKMADIKVGDDAYGVFFVATLK
jgi:hypothetical protein